MENHPFWMDHSAINDSSHSFFAYVYQAGYLKMVPSCWIRDPPQETSASKVGFRTVKKIGGFHTNLSHTNPLAFRQFLWEKIGRTRHERPGGIGVYFQKKPFGGFHKWGISKMVGLWWKILLKWMIWGYPISGNHHFGSHCSLANTTWIHKSDDEGFKHHVHYCTFRRNSPNPWQE